SPSLSLGRNSGNSTRQMKIDGPLEASRLPPDRASPRSLPMFKVLGSAATDCSGVTRRNFLQAGVLGGLALADLARIRAAAPPRRDTSVILFWLSGGPGHMETWDPKPDAVAQFRGPFGAVRTSVPGTLFGELLPNH